MATEQVTHAETVMLCLRGLQRYWNQINPDDHQPYRVVGSIMTDKKAALEIHLPNLVMRIDLLNKMKQDLNTNRGIVVAAWCTLLAINDVALGNYEFARNSIELADKAMLDI